MRFILFNGIRKACPEGQHGHPGAGTCHDITKPHKGEKANEWHRKHGLVTFKGDTEEPSKGENEPNSEKPLKEEEKKDKKEKTKFSENYSSDGNATTKIQNVVLNSFKESVESAFEKDGSKSPFKEAEKKIETIDEILSSKKIKAVEGLEKIGVRVGNPRNINGLFQGENKTALFEGIKTAMQNCPYIYSAFRELGSRQLGKASGWASYSGEIVLNSTYFKKGKVAQTQKSCMLPKSLISPNGVANDTITWWFQTFPESKTTEEIMRMSEEQATKDYIKTVITHEIGHQMGYKYCAIMEYVDTIETQYRMLFDDEPPKNVPLKDLEEMIFKKEAEMKGGAIRTNFNLGQLLTSSLKTPSSYNMAIELSSLDLECRKLYSQIYDIPMDEINPFDVYSAYGYYGKSLYLHPYKQAPPSSEKNRDDFVHERVAEAFADVCNRGENANSMSKIIVSYMNYRIGQKLGNSSEAKSFKKYLFEMHPELLEEMKNNRKVKSLRKYIVHSQLL